MLVEQALALDVDCSKPTAILKYSVTSRFVDAQIIDSYEKTTASCNTGTLRFCYTRSRSVKTRSDSNIVLSCLHFFPIMLNFMQKIDYFVPIFGPFLPYLDRLKPVFRIKFSKIGNLQDLIKKITLRKRCSFPYVIP